MTRSLLTLLRSLALAALVGASMVPVAAAEASTPAPPVQPGEFTLAVIPDTQAYVNSDQWYPLAAAQTNWLAENKTNLKLKMVSHLGDLVETWPNVLQWQRISDDITTLGNAGVPYAVLPGNHDMDVTTVAGRASINVRTLRPSAAGMRPEDDRRDALR